MTDTTATEGAVRIILSDPAVDRLIPLVQRSAARAALLRDSRLEIQISEYGKLAARVVTGLY
jgi:hypothetical protein